jgi:2-keto-4-pentenoate hydratase/2-oxohepta-3-ene-1,7-dioic acid hydratase in catechol pathway
MKICRFDDSRLGVVEGDRIKDVTSVLDILPAYRVPLPRFDPVIASLPRLLPLIREALAEAPAVPLSGARLLSPVGNPGKIVAAPVNYRAHLDEVNESAALHHGNQINEIQRAGVFLKATSSLIGVSDSVQLRFLDRRNDHEVELAAIIGKPANKVSKAEALDVVAGYAIGLDMTLRGPEERSFRKSIDTYTVLGPWMVTADELPDPTALDLQITVSGALRQKANTRDLILSVADLIAFASSFYTLQPGDILLTGTPEGVGPVTPGDRMVASISGIGEITVDVTGS